MRKASGRTTTGGLARPRAATCTVLTALTALLLAPALLGPAATPAHAAGTGELSNALLDHWVAAMGEIAAQAAADTNGPTAAQIDQASLDGLCRKAGFASTAECSCTALYASVLLLGYDQPNRRFIDPVVAVERRIQWSRARSDAAQPANAAVARDERMLGALRAAFPGGVPPAHLLLMTAYFHDRMPRDVTVWRGFLNGTKSFEATVLANQCAVPGLTSAARR